MFVFKPLVPGLTPTTTERYLEEVDRPDIKVWPNSRAAAVVRRGIIEANHTLCLRAGDVVVWADKNASDVHRGSRGILLGFRGREVLVRFPAASRYQSVLELNTDTRPTVDWQGFVDPGNVTPDES